MCLPPRYSDKWHGCLKTKLKQDSSNMHSSFLACLGLLQKLSSAYLVCGFLVLSLHRVFSAIGFTAISVGRASSIAPDITKARVSAGRILTLIRRQPTIDSYSKDGIKLVRVGMPYKLKYTYVIQLVSARIHLVFVINMVFGQTFRLIPFTCITLSYGFNPKSSQCNTYCQDYSNLEFFFHYVQKRSATYTLIEN